MEFPDRLQADYFCTRNYGLIVERECYSYQTERGKEFGIRTDDIKIPVQVGSNLLKNMENVIHIVTRLTEDESIYLQDSLPVAVSMRELSVYREPNDTSLNIVMSRLIHNKVQRLLSVWHEA